MRNTNRQTITRSTELEAKLVRACPVFLRKYKHGSINAFLLVSGWVFDNDLYKISENIIIPGEDVEQQYMLWVPISPEGGILPEDIKEATGILLKAYTDKNGNNKLNDVIEALSELLQPVEDVSTR